MTAEPEPADETPLPTSSPWKAVGFAAFVLACVAIVYLTPLRETFSSGGREHLRVEIDELGSWAPWAFVGLTIVGVAIGVPRLALAALGGLLFDWLLGAALAQVGALLGCWITFAVGRALGRDFIDGAVRRRLPRAGSLLDFIGRHGFAANVLLRLTPVGNAFVTSLLMAVSPVSTGIFLLGTFLGTAPETVIVALGASAARGDQAGLRLTVAACSLVLLALGVWWWTRRTSRARR